MRVQGEWKKNLKNGKGIYYFKDGSVYEGEWEDGYRSGIGVRTFSDGRMKGGLWRIGKLVRNLLSIYKKIAVAYRVQVVRMKN